MEYIIKDYCTIKRLCVVLIEGDMYMLDWKDQEIEDGVLKIFKPNHILEFPLSMIKEIYTLNPVSDNKELMDKYKKWSIPKLEVIQGDLVDLCEKGSD